MRLCYIGDPSSVHTQRWVRWFAAEHDVTVICTSDDGALADLNTHVLPTAARPGLRLAESVRAVRRIVASERPDLVHAHFINEAGWFGAACGTRPLVVTAWGSDVYRAPMESRFARRLNPWAVRRANHVTCDSRDQARVLRSWGVREERISVINWGVDRREFHPGVDGLALRAKLEIPADAPVVLSPRQWLPNSNIDVVVAAHAHLPDDVFLLLKRLPRFEYGRGEAVEQAIAASPARDRVRVLEEIAAEELPGLYAAGDVVVSLCVTDGTAVSVLEAMALGRPVVALANDSIAEWVSEPGGRLVASLDPGAVAAALAPFLTDPAARARAAAHNVTVVEARADRSAEMERMADTYKRLTGPGRVAKRRRSA